MQCGQSVVQFNSVWSQAYVVAASLVVVAAELSYASAASACAQNWNVFRREPSIDEIYQNGERECRPGSGSVNLIRFLRPRSPEQDAISAAILGDSSLRLARWKGNCTGGETIGGRSINCSSSLDKGIFVETKTYIDITWQAAVVFDKNLATRFGGIDDSDPCSSAAIEMVTEYVRRYNSTLIEHNTDLGSVCYSLTNDVDSNEVEYQDVQ